MKKVIFILSVLFITISIFELFLRFSPFSYGITPMQYDKDIGLWHKKNFSSNTIKECYKTKYFFDEEGRVKNNYDVDIKKQNIVLIGDSYVEALMVNNDNVIHNSLYKEINGKYNILNYGLLGTGPSHQLEILKSKVNLEKVQRLIHFVFLENDLNDGIPGNINGNNRPRVYMKFNSLDDYEIIKPKPYNAKEKIRDFIGQFEMYVYLKKTYYFYSSKIKKIFSKQIKQINKVNNKESNNKYEISNEEYKWMQLNGSIYQINKIAKEENFKYSIVYISSYESDKYIKYRERFETFLNEQNIEHINIFNFLQQLSNKQKIDFECDRHWNDNTHQELAKYLNKKLSL